MARLRVALVGCGIISENHLRAYQAHAGRAEVALCCDPDRAKADALAAQAGAEAVYDFNAVLDDPSIDSVDILTPHHLHRGHAVESLAAGKHVLLQKPLAHDLADAEAILAAEREAKTVLFYAEMNRTARTSRKARQAIEEGRIGTLVGTQATYSNWQGGAYLETSWRYDPKTAGGGQLFDGGIHAIATMTTVAGPIASVAAMSERFRPELGGEDTSALTVRYENGAVGNLFSSHASGAWFPGPHFVAFGTEGLLAIGGQHPLAIHRRGLPDGKEILLSERGDTFADMVGAYLDAVLEGAPNISSAASGMHDMRVVMAAYRSSESGRIENP